MNTTLRRARSWAWAFLYSAVVLGFFEGAARLALANRAFFQRIDGEDETSWRIRWAQRHRENPKALYYAFDVFSPTRGWALRPNLRGQPVFGQWGLASNARGIRGHTEYPYSKPRDTQRILALGDSFTFGESVSDADAYPSRLQELLPGGEVLNMGVHGYGHDQMLIYLREEGVKYHPDVVLLGFVADDMERNLLSFRDYAKPRYVLREGRLFLTNTPVLTPKEMLERQDYGSRFFDLLRMLRDRIRDRTGAQHVAARTLTAAILDEMVHTIREAGAVPFFAYLPAYRDLQDIDAQTEPEKFFIEYCQGRGVPMVNVRPYFSYKLRQGAKFKTTGHWDATGHRTAADAIRAGFLDAGLTPAGARATP